MPISKGEEALAEFVRACYDDPLEFVLTAYPWRQPGTFLEYHDGPDRWQEDWLLEWGELIKDRAFDGRTPVLPVRKATSSGHGVGKSALRSSVATRRSRLREQRSFSSGVRPLRSRMSRTA
ncbi:MAG: hypothetical protein LC804_26120 [Acidobacteria bacterium]|nr:hypothetical protein [Acidobacteriota bacterium]